MQARHLIAILAAVAAAPAQAGGDEVPVATTQHEARIGGHKVAYTAEAGRLPIRDMESGELRGRIFYVAYRVAPAADQPRPVMFSWGGGPSGPALEEHLTYGPRTVTDDGHIEDNDLSLLPVTDLVFVDPVGTGFSRPERPEYVTEFYGTTGDARATAEFVRVWIATHDAETAPIFLNGQSYGVWRAAFAAELLEKSGRRLAGLVLTSGGTGMANEYADRPFQIAYRVPDYAATALARGRLPAELGTSPEEAWHKAEDWARDTYGSALAHVDTLTDAEREGIARDLARYTGYPLDLVNRQTLSFTPPQYLKNFNGEGGARLNTFDMRRDNGADAGNGDHAARDRAMARYLREELGYRTDLAYIGLETGYTPVTAPAYVPVGAHWNYDSGDPNQVMPPPDGGPPGKEPWVRRAIDIDPNLQVFVEAAVYDSLNFCAANEDRRRRMPPELADNFEMHCYFAGHGSFRDPDSHPLLVRDIRDFIRRIAK